jgi:hypothetical protein
MEMLGNPSWRWGLSLIVLTMMFHAAALLPMAFVGMRIRLQMETRSLHQWSLIAILICATGLTGLLLAMLLGIECGIWALTYLWLGVVDSPTNALIYSFDSMATLGASGLTLQRPWQVMGGLEAVNGMLLFGVSTAYAFAVMQLYWSMLAKYVTPSGS